MSTGFFEKYLSSSHEMKSVYSSDFSISAKSCNIAIKNNHDLELFLTIRK